MDIRVSGHQIETGDALKTHAEDRLFAIADKHFSRALTAHATFGKGPHDSFQCDIVMHVMAGLILKGTGHAQDAHQAFESSATKIEKQLRRYMRRLQDRHTQAQHAMKEEEAAYTIFSDSYEEEAEAPDAPLIIAETRTDVPVSTVADAVMLLDLRNTNALFFKNSGTGRHNMVYRRSDGTVGWVEPHG